LPGIKANERKYLMNIKKLIRILGSVVLLCLVLSMGEVCALENQPDKSEDYFDMSIEKLMEVPVVVSASRQEQKISELSVPVTVITAEDIHYSGLTSIAEILQFATGVDVVRLDRSRYMVGVRGLESTVSDRTLVLINGRSTLDPVFGTSWMELPVLVEDIERIEIVRGPGGAVWGSNAYTGVINIITKKPEDTKGVFSSTTINEFGDSYTHLRFAGVDKKFSFRVSAGYEGLEDSDAAGAGRMFSKHPSLNPFMGFDTFKANDFFRSYKFDTDFGYKLSEDSKLSFGAAHSSSEGGNREFVGYFPRNNFLTSITRLYSRIDHKFDENTNGYLQWFGNFASFDNSYVIRRYAFNENDIEGQINFRPNDKHNISIGGNLRWVHITSDNASLINESVFNESAYDEYWAGLYVVDKFRLSDRWTLEGQARIDHFSKTQTDWSARAAALYALDEDKNHILRFAYGRSFRAGSTSLREFNLTGLGGLFNVHGIGSELKNENIYSLEAGYTGKFSENLTFSLNTFYQRMERLIGAVNRVDVIWFVPITTSTFVNTGGANMYGVEAELETKINKNSSLSAWYSYNYLDLDHYAQVIRSFNPARHKTGLTYRWFIDKNWVFNLNYSNTIISDAIEIFSTGDTQLSPFNKKQTINRLDLTISRKICKGNGELMIGVADVLNKTIPAASDFNNFTGFETPGRMFFGRLQIHF
jgi:iron complex outermembrane receptor protein